MKKLLNVLYITSPDVYLSRDGENVVVLSENEEKFRVPIHNLESIVCFNYTGASPSLMGLCSERNVGLCFLNESGKFLARVTGPVRGNVLLRKNQYKMSDDTNVCTEIAANCISAKIANSRTVLQRCIRDHGQNVDIDILSEASGYLSERLKLVRKSKNLEEVRGIEGDCAKKYFSVFNELILYQKEHFYMSERSKRPPRDNLNALLSFLYTLLAHDVESAIESVGLDPYVGFLHRDRPGRASLALDIMEELRAYLVDRLVVSLINRKQINAEGFKTRENGGVAMDSDTRKVVITAWQERKKEEITHPFLGEKINIGLLAYVQSLLMARYIRGDLDGYPPFIWR